MHEQAVAVVLTLSLLSHPGWLQTGNSLETVFLIRSQHRNRGWCWNGFFSSLCRHHYRLPVVKGANLGVNDTPVFLLNEYIVELNPANFNILNQILNWIFLKFLKLNKFLNWISLNWIMFWIEFCPKFSYWIFYWIEFCPKISYWIFYWTESGLKTENQLYFESILWYYTLKVKYPKNTPKS